MPVDCAGKQYVLFSFIKFTKGLTNCHRDKVCMIKLIEGLEFFGNKKEDLKISFNFKNTF